MYLIAPPILLSAVARSNVTIVPVVVQPNCAPIPSYPLIGCEHVCHAVIPALKEPDYYETMLAISGPTFTAACAKPQDLCCIGYTSP